MRLANISNGLIYPHDDVCYFQSQYGHHYATGYFRIDSMPLRAVIELIRGGQITVIDGTRKRNKLPDAIKFGLTTWCLVFNRALHFKNTTVAEWQTPEMARVAIRDKHRQSVSTIRKLAHYYRTNKSRPAIIGENVLLEIHQAIGHDDKPKRIVRELYKLGELSNDSPALLEQR